MPQKHKPKRLEEIAIVAVGSWLKICGQYFIGGEVQLAEVREELFAMVPWYLFDKVAEQVLMSVEELIDEKNVRYAALSEVALHHRIKQIDFSKWRSTVEHILLQNLCRLRDIKCLHSPHRPGLWYKHPFTTNKYFLSGFQHMTKLTTCCLTHIANNGMISALGSNCPALQKLDISYSAFVTDCGLPALFNCKNLREVRLYKTSVTSAGYKDLLLHLPDLRTLGICDDFGSILEQVHEQTSNPLSLESIDIRQITSEKFKHLIHYCPSLKNLSWRHEENYRPTDDFSILKEFQNLQNLQLHYFDFFSDCVKQILEYIGCNLYVLQLVRVKNIDLIHISQYCPNLKNIWFFECEFADFNVIYFDHKKLAVLPFSYIQRLQCDYDCPQVHLEFLMSHCKNVKYIELRLETINDAFMSRVFAQNQMKSLEELITYNSVDLSMQSVELLMTHCDQLRAISDLKLWKGISLSQLADFRAYIRCNNIDLTLDPP